MGVLAMVLSLIIVPVVSLFTKKPENVDEMFKCYSQKVVVTSDVALTEKDKNVDENGITEEKNKEAAEDTASYVEQE
jgi:hypothetical protein